MSIPNTTYRFLVEKLGGTTAESFVGNEGEVFYDPDSPTPTLRLSDGSTPGGQYVGITTSSIVANQINVSGIVTATSFEGNLTGTATTATTVDILNTNGLTTVYYPTFVENRTDGQILRGDVDFTYVTDDNRLTVPNISATAVNLNGPLSLRVYANTAARDAAIPTPTAGMVVYVTGVGMQVRGATSWNTIAGSGT